MGALTEFFMDKDTFKIDFPENISLETKAVLLGATMLVVKNLLLSLKLAFCSKKYFLFSEFQDYMFFERNKNEN